MTQLKDIENCDRDALLSVWSDLHGAPAPKGIGQSMLRRFLAFEIQARQHGGLTKATQAALHAADKPKATPKLKPGGRLIREWNRVTHVVDVTERGFVWRGQTWRSLSAIAREITGAHWSGPRFFGLGKAKP